MTLCEQVERSIIKKYRKGIWNRFIGGIKDYRMISAGDKIAVCISGGKDSMLLAKCMQQLQKYSEIPFDLCFLSMDPGYTEENRLRLEENAEQLGITLTQFQTRIFHIVSKEEKSPCYLCARMRRGCLYKHAQELGCNKIALGHHFDDVVETVLMSMFYGAEMKTMMPKLHSQNYPGMELIRPLYLVKEEEIRRWAANSGLTFLNCACMVTEKRAQEGIDASKRDAVKRLIAQLRREGANIDQNIFKSTHCANLGALIGYKDQCGTEHSFLAWYGEE